MEESVSRKQVIVSNSFAESRMYIYEQGIDMFGFFQAERYQQQIERSLATLPDYFAVYPECRYLATKSRMYRNII